VQITHITHKKFLNQGILMTINFRKTSLYPKFWAKESSWWN